MLGHDDVAIEVAHPGNDLEVVTFGVDLQNPDVFGNVARLHERIQRSRFYPDCVSPADLVGVGALEHRVPERQACTLRVNRKMEVEPAVGVRYCTGMHGHSWIVSVASAE